MDSFLHNIYEVCVDGLHFMEWKHFLCIFIRFSSGMQRKEGERAGEREGEGRRSVQEHVREEARDETPAGDSWQLFFTDFVHAEPMHHSCCPHAPRGVCGGTSADLEQESHWGPSSLLVSAHGVCWSQWPSSWAAHTSPLWLCPANLDSQVTLNKIYIYVYIYIFD